MASPNASVPPVATFMQIESEESGFFGKRAANKVHSFLPERDDLARICRRSVSD